VGEGIKNRKREAALRDPNMGANSLKNLRDETADQHMRGGDSDGGT